jgi:hypothetical protein
MSPTSFATRTGKTVVLYLSYSIRIYWVEDGRTEGFIKEEMRMEWRREGAGRWTNEWKEEEWLD